MTKVPWRTKGQNQSNVFIATYPGQCTSVDQFQSSQAGFVAQLKGKLTTRRYHYGTIFVDHFSRLRYVHFMTAQTSAETLQAKQAFERFASERGVRIRHYHCDNGRFADNAFKQHAEQQQQTLTFCGINAHFQNGIAERAIRDLTEAAWKQLLHAKARWPKCIHLALWPYAMRCALHIYNTAPVLEDGTSRKTLPKWSPRARLGVNLGPSPHHVQNVNLVLNIDTGLCSPQFHCRNDDFFETIDLNKPDTMMSSSWQILAGL
ncbi:hypothetical protein ACHAW6_010465, partial [Cyclotella cf. meneghiniana]